MHSSGWDGGDNGWRCRRRAAGSLPVPPVTPSTRGEGGRPWPRLPHSIPRIPACAASRRCTPGDTRQARSPRLRATHHYGVAAGDFAALVVRAAGGAGDELVAQQPAPLLVGLVAGEPGLARCSQGHALDRLPDPELLRAGGRVAQVPPPHSAIQARGIGLPLFAHMEVGWLPRASPDWTPAGQALPAPALPPIPGMQALVGPAPAPIPAGHGAHTWLGLSESTTTAVTSAS